MTARFPVHRLCVPGLAALVAGGALAEPDASPGSGDARRPVAEIEGRVWYEDEVRGATAFRIYQHQIDIHSLLQGEAERRVDALLLEREATRRGVAVEALLEQVQAGAEPVSDAAVEAYLAEHPTEAGAPPAEVRARVRHYLEETGRLERRIDFLVSLRERAGYRFLLAPPEPPRTEVDVAGAPARGPEDAPVTIVHFGSFASRNSARAAAKIARLAAEFPGRIRHVHRNLLRERDERGLHAARLGAAAQQAGRFWPLHDAWFERAGKLDREAIEALARTHGLDDERVAAAGTDDGLLRRVKADLDAARAAGAPREPTLFVNGRYLPGIAPYDELRAAVAEELERAASR